MISIIIPTIRPQNIPALLDAIKKNTSVVHEVLWEIDEDKIGCPLMVKRLVDKAKYDWIVFLGDDTLPEKDCIDNAYIMALEQKLWLVGFNDHDTMRATHWLAHKMLLNYLENREFFYTGYIHNFCDDELRIRTEIMNRYGWCKDARITHNHPAFDSKFMDSSYEKQTSRAYWDHDQALFNSRNK